MGAPPDPEAALRELLDAVERQLAAARAANAAALTVATEHRRGLQDAMHPALFVGLDHNRRNEVVRLARQIRMLDARIRACGESVLGVIAAMALERAPQTYSRHGLLRSAP
jgi:hypothetical protein